MWIGIDASRAMRPRRTGTERYSLEIIRHLLALPQAHQHQWRLYVDHLPCAKEPRDNEPGMNEPWRVDALPDHAEFCLLPARRMWTHRALARELLQRPPHVLFVPSHVIPFVLPPHRLPPSVVTIHDMGYLHFPEAHPWKERLYLDWATRWSVAAATEVIAISQATAADLHQHLHVDVDKTHVVYEAVASLPIPSADSIAALRARLQLTRPYALYVGTIQPRKNLTRLLNAYEQLCRQGTASFDLMLAGGAGWFSQAILLQAEQSPYADRIHLPGYVTDADLPALMGGAEFFTFPSLYEGFGLPILEAQSLGVPVMSAKGSSLPEVAGDAALYVDPTDVEAIAQAMLRLSQDEALRQELIAAGHRNVQRFSWEKAAAETLAVLEEAARKHS
jgi:glycosyltransferase involved in cell wall biosynthesis